MTDPLAPFATARAIADAVASGAVRATAVTEAALARIEATDPAVNAFTAVTAGRALAEAAAVDATLAAGRPVGPLAGVPWAAKNLFDIAGITTRAGAALTAADPLAACDADLVARMTAAGAACLGALHMGEFAYDFTGENAHDGPCRNPHDTMRMTGGSSSGSAAAVAAGMVPLSLGSDTNGSLRVPAALCGIFSLKPTFGRLPRGGTFPFVDSLDHLGPMARTVGDLALAYDTLQGGSDRDHACPGRPVAPVLPTLEAAPRGLRTGRLRGWFEAPCDPAVLAARDRVAGALVRLGAVEDIVLDGAEAGRAAAYLLTNAESSALHLPRLRRDAAAYDPDTRDRFLAGALLPAAWLVRAQQVRHWWLGRVLEVFRHVDVLLAPATPVTAPAIGARTLDLGGRTVPLRPYLGLLAQPFSCIGLPVVTVPAFAQGGAPLGVQIVAPPWREDVALRAARWLEAEAVSAAHRPSPVTARRPAPGPARSVA
jgi:aspartyl-tRNA(Asn)/glutamyl-tRNA(Gln) amidotransferase subunit A